jgi:hypothetical protein
MDSLYINGVERTNYVRIGTPDFDFQLNTRAIFSMEFLDTSGLVRPDLDDEVIYTTNERTLTVSIGAGNVVVTASVGTFTADDEGRAIVIPGAGTAGADHHAKILTFMSGSQVEIEIAAVTTVASASARVGDRKFCGMIVDYDEQPFFADDGILMRIDCADYNAAAEEVLINGISSAGAGTLRDHVDWSLTSGLDSQYGIVRDPAMAAGPTLGVLGYAFKYIMEVWKDLSLKSGWVFVIDQFKVVRWIEPGTWLAPFDLDSSYPLADTVKINKTYNQYRNSQWVWYGGSGQFEYTDTATGDGSTARWTLTGAPVGGVISRGYITVTISGATYDLPVGREGVDALEWTYNPLTNELVRSSALGSGDSWSLIYLTQGPLVVNRTDPAGITAHRLRTKITQVDSITNAADAEAHADDLLRRYSRTPRVLTFDTYDDRLRPGMTITVNLPNRGISSIDFLIDSMATRDDESGQENDHLIYSVHAIEGEEFFNLWIEFYRDQAGGSLGTTTGSPAPAPTPPGLGTGFPVVTGWLSRVTSSVSNYTITFPPHNPGDRLMVFIGHSSHNDLSINAAGSSSGWVQVFQDDVALSLPTVALFSKIAVSSNEQLVITNATSNIAHWIALVLTNAAEVEASAEVVLNPQNTNIDPPSLAMSRGFDNHLWMVVMMQTGGVGPTPVPPTGFGNTIQTTFSTGNTRINLARREEAAASKDPAAWSHGNAVAITFTVGVAPAYSDPVTPPLHSDDFNGANSLATDGYQNISGSVSKVAGIGPDGSQAVRSTTDNGEYTTPTLTPAGRTGVLTFDSKTSRNGVWAYVAEVRRSSAWIISIYRNDSTMTNGLEIYTGAGGFTPIVTSNNFWNETGWGEVEVRWQLSTYDGGTFTYNTDGYIQVYMDGVLVIDEQNIDVSDNVASGLEAWDRIVFAPQGDMDNLNVTD